MADRAYIYCPLCAKNGTKAELVRDGDMFQCPIQHRFTGEQMRTMNDLEMIKLQPIYRPRPADIKIEFFCHPEIAQKVRTIFGDGYHRTLESILEVCVSGDYVLVDGAQASELRKRNIKNGAEMIACAKNNEELVAENDELKKDVMKYERIFASAAQSASQ